MSNSVNGDREQRYGGFLLIRLSFHKFLFLSPFRRFVFVGFDKFLLYFIFGEFPLCKYNNEVDRDYDVFQRKRLIDGLRRNLNMLRCSWITCCLNVIVSLILVSCSSKLLV